MSFKNKVVLVTGGSSGIGEAISILFAKEGANVAIVGRNEAKLKTVAEKISKVGNQPLVIKADIVSEDAPKAIVDKTIEVFGKIDVLVNNAGIVSNTNIFEEDFLKEYDLVINTNLRAVVAITNYASSHVVKTKGNIVNISSVLGKRLLNAPNFTAYCISKAGVDHFTRSAALSFAKYGVRVNSISPAATKTNIFDKDGEKFDWNLYNENSVLSRVSDPEEIADLVLYIASDKARSITGADYLIDNGTFLIK